MSNIKNKTTIYAVLRQVEYDGQASTTVCCFCKTLGKAEDLCGVYLQEWIDSGADQGAVDFYPVANSYYNE